MDSLYIKLAVSATLRRTGHIGSSTLNLWAAIAYFGHSGATNALLTAGLRYPRHPAHGDLGHSFANTFRGFSAANHSRSFPPNKKPRRYLTWMSYVRRAAKRRTRPRSHAPESHRHFELNRQLLEVCGSATTLSSTLSRISASLAAPACSARIAPPSTRCGSTNRRAAWVIRRRETISRS